MHYSARAGCEQCLRSLLEVGANVEARDNDDRTALHVAATGGRVKSDKKLCEEIRVANSAGQASSHVAMNQCTDGNAEVVRALLAAGANVEAVDIEQKKPFQLAVENDCPNIVDLLLVHNASVEMTDVGNASATIKAMLHKAQHQRAHVDDTVARIVQMNKERKAKVLNAECITQGDPLTRDRYGLVHAGVWAPARCRQRGLIAVGAFVSSTFASIINKIFLTETIEK